eukprot:COSAG02_NODE_52140_length_309_cov_1.461905_2_plen_37_part_01
MVLRGTQDGVESVISLGPVANLLNCIGRVRPVRRKDC